MVRGNKTIKKHSSETSHVTRPKREGGKGGGKGTRNNGPENEMEEKKTAYSQHYDFTLPDPTLN